MNTRALFLFLLLPLGACHITDAALTGVAAGTASIIAVYDQMLADGLMTPEQHRTLVDNTQKLQSSAADAAAIAAQAKDLAEKARAGGLTPEEGVAGLSGTALLILGLIRKWRGPATAAENVAKAAKVAIAKVETATPTT